MNLVDLPPFFCTLIRETLVNHRHDLIEQLAIDNHQSRPSPWTSRDHIYIPRPRCNSLAMCPIRNLLHQRRRRTPWFIVCSFPDLISRVQSRQHQSISIISIQRQKKDYVMKAPEEKRGVLCLGGGRGTENTKGSDSARTLTSMSV